MNTEQQSQATSQLVFYPLPNWAGTGTHIAHGDSNVVATSTTDWQQQSVAVGTDGIQAFLFSETDTIQPSLSYTGHTESMVTDNLSNLKTTFPAPQYPFQYLGVDVNLASRVVLSLDVPAGDPDALAATWLLPDTQASFTTLTLAQADGTLAFVGTADTSTTTVRCMYGTLNAADGTVARTGSGTLSLMRDGTAITLLSADGFPAGWTFGKPPP